MEYDEQALRELLFKHFGWDRFRSSTQLEAIQAVLSRRNVFVRSGTGSGKSLIWQVCDYYSHSLFSSSIPRKFCQKIILVGCTSKSAHCWRKEADGRRISNQSSVA